MGRGRFASTGRRPSSFDMEVGPRPGLVLPPPSSTGARTPDPALMRNIRDVDAALGLEWDPEGIWWTPASMIPPGVSERGAWAVTLRGVSGATRRLRMWHPDCADGRLVEYLQQTWGAQMYALRAQSSSRELRAERLARVRADRERLEREMFHAWWKDVDHSEMHRAVKELHFDPKWRGGWQVHPDTPVGASPAPAETAG